MDKYKKVLTISWFLFLLFLGIYFLLKSMDVFGDEYGYDYECSNNPRMLKYSQYAYYIKEREYHYKQAMYHYEQAYMACWYCPRVADQEKARMCLTSAGSTLGTTSLQGALIASITTLLVQYGCECMREWHYIKTNLNECKYHIEMYEFYLEILTKA